MSRILTFLVALTTVLVFTFAASAVNVPITIGASDSFSRYPIGLDPSSVGTAFPNFAAGGVYQQVYAKSAFSAPVTITQIAFASNAQMTSGPGTANYDFTLKLGTTAVGPNSLSTDLAANRGADLVPVFSGPLTSTITDSDQFDVFIDITPFTYDPAKGNLLLELTMNSPVQFSAGQFLYYRAGNDSRTSRAANPTGVAGGAFTDSFGLLTRFMTSTTSPAQVTLSNLVQTFDGNAKSVSVTTNPPGLSFAVTYNGSASVPVNAGVYAVTATITDPAFEGQASGNLVIQSADQQITFDALANKAFGDADFNVTATASSNLAVAFSASGNCSTAGTLVHLTGVGQCTVTASQEGNSNYHAATPVARTFTIGKADQQITFDALSNKIIGDADFNVTASSSSNLTVTFVAAGNCSITGTQVHLTGAGQCTITASQEGNGEYNAATPVARSFSIGKADQQITFDALANKTFGDADFSVTATASSTLAVSFAAVGNCTVENSQVHLNGAGACTITATQDGSADYNPATPVARSFTIGKGDQQITFDALPNKTVGDADFNVGAASTSNLPVAFSAAGSCNLNGTQVHLSGAGQCTITALQDGDANYNAAAPVARAFAIGKAEQQITFDPLANKTVGDADFNVSASASSNLGVAFAAGGNCTVNGTQVHLTSAGACTITAAQEGDANYNPAVPVARTFSIAKANQQITFDALANKKLGDADFGLTAAASSSLAVTFSAAGNCTIAGALVHLSGAGQCSITASQDGDADYNAATPVVRTFTIGKADQQISFAALAAKTVGDPDFAITATASSNLNVSLTAAGNCTVNGSQVHLTGAGQCAITATQEGSADYNAATPVSRSFTIGKAGQQIAFDALANKTAGDLDFNVSATATSNLAVTFSAGGNCTIAGVQVHLTGAGTCTITAAQEGDANYETAAAVARTFSISKADQQITFAALAARKLGEADFNVSASVSSNLAVSFTAGGSCTVTGALVHLTGAGECTITAAQSGDDNYNAAISVAQKFLISKGDQQITFEALEDKKFGDADYAVKPTASSNLAVAIAAAGNCTVSGTQVHLTGAGQCTITASQDGNTDYNAATPVARSFSIAKADQQITFAGLSNKKVGDPNVSVSATASSGLAVTFAASGKCEISANQVQLNGAGDCTVTASQDGDSNYNAAPAIARTFSIGKADQQIAFAALANRVFGEADFAVSATASSMLPVAFAASGQCTIAGNQIHLTGAGNCTVTASQDGDVNYGPAAAVSRTFSIARADQQITFEAVPDKRYGDADFNISANASSGLPVAMTANGNCAINGTLVHLSGAGGCTLTAKQDGNSDYQPATPVVRTFNTSKADQQITFDALATKTTADADFTVTAVASSGLSVSFTGTGSCTLTGTQVHLMAAGMCTITASQDGDANYNAATPVANSFAITEQAPQTVISFGSPTYPVTEKVGVVRLNVTRSGDTSAANTVDYVTDDTGAPVDCAKINGLASSRCDFNTAVGTLKFGPGETEKTVEVLVNQDSYLEAPFESFSVKLSNVTGNATLGTLATATVQINDASGGLSPTFNVVDDTRSFVRQQYHDFLNREPDAAGLAFWIDNIDQCDDPARKPASMTVAQCKQVMRINTSAAFFLSIEFSESGGLVHAFYAAALDRPNGLPNYLEFIRDTQAVGRGVIVGEGNWQQTLKENREAFMNDFVMRPEFVGLYPTVDSTTSYVNKLYLHALGRPATAAEVEQGITEFGGADSARDAGARARALLQVTKAADFSSEVNRSFVQMQYIGYLRRNANELPDTNFDGYDFWLQKLNRFNGNYIDAEMVRAFIESFEYRARFGP